VFASRVYGSVGPFAMRAGREWAYTQQSLAHKDPHWPARAKPFARRYQQPLAFFMAELDLLKGVQ